jgi:hypothetical protein
MWRWNGPSDIEIRDAISSKGDTHQRFARLTPNNRLRCWCGFSFGGRPYESLEPWLSHGLPPVSADQFALELFSGGVRSWEKHPN